MLVPELLDKLKVVEEKKPVNNATTNIIRIRELIAQARSVAKKVSSSLYTCSQCGQFRAVNSSSLLAQLHIY